MRLRLAASPAVVLAITLALTGCGPGDAAGSPRHERGIVEAFDGLPGDPALLDIAAIDEPRRVLASAEARDRFGRPIGSVSEVRVSPEGAAVGVVIALDNGLLVEATPLQARFDDREGAVVVHVGLEQLEPVG